MENLFMIEGIIGVSLFGLILGAGLLMLLHSYMEDKKMEKMVKMTQTKIVPEMEEMTKRMMKDMIKVMTKEMVKMTKEISKSMYDD